MPKHDSNKEETNIVTLPRQGRRKKRAGDVENCLREMSQLPDFPNDIRLVGREIEFSCYCAVGVNGPDTVRTVMYHTEKGARDVAGALLMDRDQWEDMKRHVDAIFRYTDTGKK